jgi:hypothetical protein
VNKKFGADSRLPWADQGTQYRPHRHTGLFGSKTHHLASFAALEFPTENEGSRREKMGHP